ncbi:hypothetical protein TNCV_803931 [Trichonephila clavipes]|nr:hypothetical protein TNCV_803931 [Trichonephila clavipes]
MLKTITDAIHCQVRSGIHFLNARNVKPVELHRQLGEVYGGNALSDEMVRRVATPHSLRNTGATHSPKTILWPLQPSGYGSEIVFPELFLSNREFETF